MRRVPTDEQDTDPDDPSSREAKRKGAAYQGATEAVFVIPIATGIGYWLDGRFDTSPYLLITGAAVGFASFVLRLVRLGRELQAFEKGDD